MVTKISFFRLLTIVLLLSTSFGVATAQSDFSANTSIPAGITAMSPDQISREVLDQLLAGSNRNEGAPNRDDAVGGNWLFVRNDNGWGGFDYMFNDAGVDNVDFMSNPADLASVDLYQ